tara:strand:+ start:351 stop:761 length:411 start_codon:yes stop_codon:yes gene_type:complete
LNKNISDKDKRDWQRFIDGKDKLNNKDLNQNRENFDKFVSIDLHGYTLSEANEYIKKTIIDSYNTGVKKILVVTGKGLHSQNEKDPYVSKDLSILKYSVPNFIEKNKELNNFIIEMKEASIEDGGSGAFYIYLKKK